LADFSRWLRSRQRPTPPELMITKHSILKGCQRAKLVALASLQDAVFLG